MPQGEDRVCVCFCFSPLGYSLLGRRHSCECTLRIYSRAYGTEDVRRIQCMVEKAPVRCEGILNGYVIGLTAEIMHRDV